MHTPLLIGSFAFFAFASVCLALFFLRAFLVRREDRQFLVFGFLCASLSAHATLTALLYAEAMGQIAWPSASTLLRAVVAPSKAASALTFHYALLHARVRHAEKYATPVYVVMGLFALLGLAGGWWAHIGEVTETEMAGLTVMSRALAPTGLAKPFYVLVPFLLSVCIALFIRRYRETRRGLGAVVGAMFLGVAVINDLGLGAGWFRTVPMFAVGFLVFTYGVALTLVARYARTATELGAKTKSLREQSMELARSYEELRRTQQELVRSEQLAVIGELAAVIAHEVRNPLAIVGNAVASLRKRHTTRGDRRTLLEIINEEMGRLDKLVGRLIHYARPVVLDKKPVDLHRVVELAAKVLDNTGVTLVQKRRRDVPPVMGDRDLLRQVFENVFSNAAQASTEGAEVQVRLARRNVGGVPVVAVEIQDEGEGMNAEQLESALNPFFTTRPTGTGLGLPIVARIVQAHGGQVQLDSEVGVGTRVSIMLPTSADKHLPGVEDGSRISLLP